jgi:thymidylate synthase
MNLEEKNYINLLSNILQNGSDRGDRTGVGTKGIFGTQLRFSLENNKVPMLTTKKMFTKGIVEELLFFLRGDTDTNKLEAKGVNIWKGNTTREFLDKRGLTNLPEGNMGPMYGAQWRNFCGVDQLKNALNLIKNDPYSRRIIISAYNPSVSNQCVLEPCHMFYQFYVNDNKLSCQFYQRSVDVFLGLPFNILSYAILTQLMAKAANLNCGELIFTGGDTHIYNTHMAQVIEQISREPYSFPQMTINKNLQTIEDMEALSFEDFKIEGYQSHPTIKASMAI